jgi:Glycosyltransferase like family 2
MTKIDCVITCCGYGDFLAVTLAENQGLLDNIVVVTTPDDEETQRVCRQQDIHYVVSDEHKRNGAEFNKARLIARGFDQIAGTDWILHLDADCVLPQKFRRLIDWAHLDPRTIYGCDRQNIVGWENWQALKRSAGCWDNHAHTHAHWFHPKYPVGSRWVSSIHSYVPIGFFQLFHGSELTKGGYHVKRYPFHHGDAARSDVQFALQWDRRHRQLIPEVIVLHLESESSALGANWKGRTTPRFGPTPLHGPKPHQPCS